MDLFYQGTMQEQVKALKKEIRALAKEKGIKISNRMALVWGIPANVGNNALIVQPPYPGGKYFQDGDTCQLQNILLSHGIQKYFLTYCYHIPQEKVTRKDIKQYGIWVRRIVDAVQPRLIVCLGEDSIFSFFKRKMILRDHHGQVVDRHEDIPVMLTYPVSYYTERSEYEDLSYKNFLLQSDWTGIKKQYDKEIQDEVV